MTYSFNGGRAPFWLCREFAVAKDEKKNDKKDKDDEKEKPEGEDAEGGEESAEGAKKLKLSKKQLIILAVVGVLVIGGGTGAAFYFAGSGKKTAETTTTEEKAAVESDHKGKAVYFSLGDLLVNLSGEGKHPNYLKLKISLELADEKDLPLMEAIKPRIIDNFQVYLRELRIEDLRGSAGLYRLREELLLRVTEAAQPVRVRSVLFQEMLVQ